MNILDFVALAAFALMSISYRLSSSHYACDCQNSSDQQCVPSKLFPRLFLFLARVRVVDVHRNDCIQANHGDHYHDNSGDCSRRCSQLNSHSEFPQKSRILSSLAQLGNDALFGFSLGSVFGVSFIGSVLLRTAS